MPRKPSIGRQKIEIRRIVSEDARQVTFSKRRTGMFKKASELCILCGAEVAIVVFSPAGKSFSFGHPSVDSVINRYLTGSAPRDASPMAPFVDAHRRANVRDLNNQYTEIMNQLEIEKKKAQELEEARKASANQFWWETPISELGLSELGVLKSSMVDLKNRIAFRANELLMNGAANAPPYEVQPPDHFLFGRAFY